MAIVGDAKNRSDAANGAANDEKRMERAHNSKKQHIKEQQKEEIDDLRAQHAERVSKMQDRHTAEIRKEKNTRERIKQNNQKMAEENYRKTADVRSRHEAELRQQQAQLEEKRQAYNEQGKNFEQRKQEEAKASQDAYKAYMREMQDNQKAQEQMQKDEHRAVMTEEQQQFEDARTRQRDHYGDEIKTERQFFKDQMHDLDRNYDVEMNKRDLSYQLALADQQQKYAGHYDQERYQYLQDLEEYKTFKEDPFYRVQDLGAKMEDKGSHYEVRLKVPEHELKNFKVHVKEDSIMVAGARRHEEELKFKGEKLATNNFQTIKQEFALGSPVDHKQVQKEYKDGFLFVTAPKKGFGIFS
ncbi:MAG: Hsp20 family protein [Bdellovibrionaceae bacterium]|nr:Hsp20 family protein [Pseudobdellovibrionaceae bacterium]